MSIVIRPTSEERHIRAIVFREGDLYVAQCLEYDIATQAADLDTLLDRLDAIVEIEFEVCGVRDPKGCISPAPNYYHKLWENRSHNILRANVETPNGPQMEIGLAKAA